MSDNINGFPVPEEPETREEQYLSAIAQVTPATQIPPKPLTRVETYLNKIVENGTGGGGGGTTNYNALENKPQINSHELTGNKSSSDLGLQAALTETQLAAVNSGIDSTKVQQISTNETNILSKANKTDVDATMANLQGQIDYIDYTISDLSSEGTIFKPCLTPERTTADTKIFAYNDALTAGKYKISIVTADDVKIYLFSKVDSTNLSLIRDYTITPVTGIAELEFYCGSNFVIGFQGVIGFTFGNGYAFLDVNKMEIATRIHRAVIRYVSI